MRIGIFLGHPAHFHYFKNMAKQLMADGHQVFFAVKEKDVLRQLMDNAGLPYTVVRSNRTSKSKLALIKSVLEIDWKVGKFVRDNKIDILFGTIISYTTRFISRKPIITCNEDDARIVPQYAFQAYPLSQCSIAPTTCDNWLWERKTVHFPGYLELAYLHPNNFTPSKSVLEKYGIDASKPYFIMRFSSLNAHHDKGIKGISNEIAERLVKILEPFGTIYITSERPLEPQFEKYRIKINPLDMHHVMAFASLYIGDSQTMAAEAGVLGVPFVRFNDFVGRIGYLRELEDKYELGYGIHASVLPADSPIRRNDGSLQPSGVEELYKRVETLVNMDADERRVLWSARRNQMLSDKVDCAKFLTWFIENYPASATETRNATPDFWDRFK